MDIGPFSELNVYIIETESFHFFITNNDVTNMVDVDHASFKRHATIRWDMCNDDCIMEACLRICGKCGDS